MTEPQNELTALRQQAYDLSQAASVLRARLHQQADLAALDKQVEELQGLEGQLAEVEKELRQAERKDPKAGLIVNTAQDTLLLGPDTTFLETSVHLNMACVPTAIYHLFSAAERPLVSCKVRNAKDDQTRRLRVTSYVEGYSARAVDTVELKPLDSHPFPQLPTLFPERIRRINELTRATLHVLVEDLDGRLELHRTHPIWLLARNTAPLELHDPASGTVHDMTPYLGAFVTPNAPSIMEFVHVATACHPDKEFVGYKSGNPVASQVRALYTALNEHAKINYVTSTIAFDPGEGTHSQRVRLPRQSLHEGQANCIDGAVLFASLLEAISINPALVVIPGHAMVAWEDPPSTASGPGAWHYLDTTKIAKETFDKACDFGERWAKVYINMQKETKDPFAFRQWPLRDLRTARGITPME